MKRKNISECFLNSWDLILLGIFAFLTRFINLSFPAKVVFDEAQFGLFSTKYYSHQYYFDFHPPLGKMLIALSNFFGEINLSFNFEAGMSYGDFNYLVLRLLPALFGSLLVILIYLFVKELGFSRRVAFLAGFLVLFDNALIVQSRLILLDAFLVFFIFLSLYFFILSKKFLIFSKKWYLINILLALSLGAAISIKWTGFGVLAIIWSFFILEEKIFRRAKKEIIIKFSLLFLTPFLIYLLIFVIHFYLIPTACSKDCGAILDCYADPRKCGLDGPLEPLSFMNNPPPHQDLLGKIVFVNRKMMETQIGMVGFHPYQSDWWSWPLMLSPILYFLEKIDNKTSYIYFIGNPFVWWFGVIGILGYSYLLIRNFFYKFKLKMPEIFYSKNTLFLLSGYFFYLLPFISFKRYLLSYSYLPALVFSIILFSIFFEGIIEIIFGSSPKNKFWFSNKKANFLFLGLLLIIFISFLFFSPLTYGIPLTDEQFQDRMWLDTWGI